MNGPTVHKDGAVVVESVVADRLEKGLPFGEQRKVVNTVSYLMIAIDVLLLSGCLDIFDEIGIVLGLSQNNKKDLNRYLDGLLHECADGSIFSSCVHFYPIFLPLVLPSTLPQKGIKSQHFIILILNLL